MFFEKCVVYTSRIVVLELDAVEVGRINVHSGAIRKEEELIKVLSSLVCGGKVSVLDEGFPFFRFFENEDSEDFAVGGKDGMEKIMSNLSIIDIMNAD